jgi:choline dehydrogenase-like flavoprotein
MRASLSPSPVSLPDPIQLGLASGWKVRDASQLHAPLVTECDVLIVGTGAGGGITAEVLSQQSGLHIIMVEEGALKSSKDFKMREADAYPQLYQEAAARKTADKAINILQGRTVGGSTTVNWTSSFRTPPDTLHFWQREFGLQDYTVDNLAPSFAAVEDLLGIAPWVTEPNRNNGILRQGAERLGFHIGEIKRNVRGCWNLGYCGMGCPTNAKQSMLVTTIPHALSRGAELITRCRVDRLIYDGHRITHIECSALSADGLTLTGQSVVIYAKHVVLAGGAINTPAILLRSKLPDPYQQIGKRTFLHPTVISAALFKETVDGFNGAPQSLYSDHFLHTYPIDGAIGYKLEAPPIHPVLFSTTLQGYGEAHHALMQQFSHTHALLALLRDGFHPESIGGQVRLHNNGAAILDYPQNDFLWHGVRRAFLSMTEIQLAAGASTVYPVHENVTTGYRSWQAAQHGISQLDLRPLLTRMVSAHVMGGCGMAHDEQRGIITPNGRYRYADNLSIHDGSLFPTSIGANPQLSIYGIVHRLSMALKTQLIGC